MAPRFAILLGAFLGHAMVETLGQPSPTACQAALKDASGDSQKMQRMIFATGTSLPWDAGKYRACMDTPGTHYVLASFKAGLLGGTPTPAELGLCVPDACGSVDAADLLGSPSIQMLIPTLRLATISNITGACPQTDLTKPGAGFGVAVGITGSLVLLVIFSTFWRSCESTPSCSTRLGSAATLETTPNSPPRSSAAASGAQSLLDNPVASAALPRQTPLVIRAFSLIGSEGTMTKLVEEAPYKPTDCLNGVRVISMMWIILGHSFLMPTAIAGFQNMQDVVDTSMNHDTAEGGAFMMFLLSANMGVDSFFFLSGFLLSLITLKELRARAGKINVAWAVALRYLRLTPSLVLAMLVYWQIWPHLAYGPFAKRFQDSIYNRCTSWWWSELTYTMNFTPFDSDKVCMGWTWYLGDDMIFFVIGMIAVPMYYRKKALGLIFIACITAASLGICTWLVVNYHLSTYIFDDHYKEYSYYAYSKPYTRAPAYLIGVGAAWYKDVLDQRGITRETRPNGRAARIGAWVLALLAVGLLVFIGGIVVTDFGSHKNSWGTATSAIYIAFSRPLWALCLAVITLLCGLGYLPAIDAFLSSKVWTPLARLTYGAYLLHPLVIKLAAGTAVQYYTFSVQDMLYHWMGNVVMAFGGSAVLWALIERPVMTFSSAMLKRKPQSAKPSTSMQSVASPLSPMTPAESRTAAAT
mmetsp:Transcript_52562/g.169601  ORF Transcript_52562/g.169601 Transcript_52562/m.169601 type:complete len:696 (+) Transcript_52562:42-2129(+)